MKIIPKLEAPFVTKAVNWPLIYRSPTELENLLLESGLQEETKIVIEPLRVFALVVAKKISERPGRGIETK